MRVPSYHALSSWRISRRITSSRVFGLPLMLILRTYTRRPLSTKNVNETVFFVLSISGTALTLANA